MVNMEDSVYFGVLVVFGIVVVAVVLGMTNSITKLNTITNETLTLGSGSVNGTTTQLAHYPLDGTALVLKNITGDVTLTASTNYTYVASTGVITWATSNSSGNVTNSNNPTWYASYQYQPTGYVTGSNATIVNNYSVLMLLGVFAFVGFFVAKAFGYFK